MTNCEYCLQKTQQLFPKYASSGVGTPLKCNCISYFCDICKEKSDCDIINKEKLLINLNKCRKSIEKRLQKNSPDDQEYTNYLLQYYFSNFKIIKNYEKFLGIKLPVYFIDKINNLICFQCKTNNFIDIQLAYQDNGICPEFPEQYRKKEIVAIMNEPVIDEWLSKFKEWQKNREYYFFCSKNCLEKMLINNNSLIIYK